MNSRSSDEAPSGICTCCGDQCEGMLVDEGIGSYEYWGAKGVHHDWVCVSRCCEAPIAEEGGIVVNIFTTHVAKKKHKNCAGRICIKPGEKYVKHYRRSWYIDEYGNRKGVVCIEKQKMQHPLKCAH